MVRVIGLEEEKKEDKQLEEVKLPENLEDLTTEHFDKKMMTYYQSEKPYIV